MDESDSNKPHKRSTGAAARNVLHPGNDRIGMSWRSEAEGREQENCPA